MTSKTNYPVWSDQSEPSLVRPAGISADGSGKSENRASWAILVSTAPDMALMSKMAEPLVFSRSFYLGKWVMNADQVLIAGPYMGAAYAVMLLENLIAEGISHVLVMGWCGALATHLEPGDLILPSRAICDEGVSRHYQKTENVLFQSSPSADLTEELAGYLEEKHHSVNRTDIWTTDAIFRETASKVRWFREQGAQAVDMECSALFSVASFHKIHLSALLVVSDLLKDDSWSSGFSQKRFKHNRKAACEHLLGFVHNCLGNNCLQKSMEETNG